MINAMQIEDKITDLTTYCMENGEPEGDYKSFISELTAAVKAYYSTPPGDLADQITYLIFKMYNDLTLRSTTYEKPVGPSMPTNYPQGYADLTAIFDCDGALTEILNINPSTFLSGFPIENVTDSATGTSSTVVKINPIIPEWISKLNAAHTSELSKIDALANWCNRGLFGQDLIGLVEDRGQSSKSRSKEEIIKDIYITKKYKEVIETFSLDVHIPTYL